MANPEQLFLERFEKTFDAAVALWFTDKGGQRLAPFCLFRILNIEPLKLALETKGLTLGTDSFGTE